ncbi:hypothetical protein [Pseudanabaena sp. PCC 6802]|uniref:hypothetical protein n=1 Tax=Pseudanabaena sp. PCC 6802 TaxID=118173 RepID=UPI00034A7017|nr:hypothetical protein [Pseudanabaena sp. PCC 6802]
MLGKLTLAIAITYLLNLQVGANPQFAPLQLWTDVQPPATQVRDLNKIYNLNLQ